MTATASQFGIWTNRAQPGWGTASTGANSIQVDADGRNPSPQYPLSPIYRSRTWVEVRGADFDFVTANEALAGTADAIFGQSGNLTGVGALSGTADAIFGQSGALTGVGALSGTADAIFGQSGALTGVGALSGTSDSLFGQSGALTGKGALSGTSDSLFGQSGALAGAGAVAGTSDSLFGQSGALAGSGALNGSSGSLFGQSGALAGAGALAGSSDSVLGQSGGLLGSGALIGTLAAIFGQSGDLTSGGAPSPTGTATAIFGQSGDLIDATPPQPQPTPAYSSPITVPTGGGGGGGFTLFLPAPAEQIRPAYTERQLETLIRAAVELAASPSTRSRVTDVLNRAGANDEVSIARALLLEAQTHSDNAVVLAAMLYAAGLHVAIVAHDSHLLVAVFAGGRWYYADPSRQFPLGQTTRFSTEVFSTVPALPTPQAVVNWISEVRAEARIAERAAAEATAAARKVRWAYAVALALVIAATALLFNARPPKTPRRRKRPPRSKHDRMGA